MLDIQPNDSDLTWAPWRLKSLFIHCPILSSRPRLNMLHIFKISISVNFVLGQCSDCVSFSKRWRRYVRIVYFPWRLFRITCLLWGPGMGIFDNYFLVNLHKIWNKQSISDASTPLWHHCRKVAPYTEIEMLPVWSLSSLTTQNVVKMTISMKLVTEISSKWLFDSL